MTTVNVFTLKSRGGVLGFPNGIRGWGRAGRMLDEADTISVTELAYAEPDARRARNGASWYGRHFDQTGD